MTSKLYLIWTKRLLLALTLAFGVVAGGDFASAQGVTAQFAKANQAYRAGKAKTAYKILTKIVKKYPDHQPSHLLLGRISFRSGQVNRAIRHFKKVPPDMLPPDAGYEYGISMFTAKDCRRAIAGFSRVPAQAREKDLAYFYSGICYIRQREFQKAQANLSRSQRLPPNLVASRREALAFTKRQLRTERQGGIAAANPYLIVPTPPPPVQPAFDPYAQQVGPPTSAQEKAKQKPARAAPPQSGFTNGVTPSVTITQTTTTNDQHGFGNSQTDVSKSELKLGFKSRYNGSPRASGKQPYFSLGLEAGQVQSDTRTVSTNYIAYEDNPTDIIEQTTEAAPTTLNALNLALTPEASYPIGSAFDLTAGFSYKESQPDDTKLDRTGTQGPYASAAFGVGDTIDIKLTFAATDTLVKGKATGTDQKIGVEFSKDWETFSIDASAKQTTTELKTPLPLPPALLAFTGTKLEIDASGTKAWDSFSVTTAANMTQFTPPSGYVKVDEQASNKVTLTMDKTFDFGGTASFSAAMQQLTAYTRFFPQKGFEADPDDPDAVVPQQAVKAEGTAQIMVGSFKLTPLEWLFASASYKYTTRTFTVSPPEYQQDFQKSVADLITELTLQVGLTKTF